MIEVVELDAPTGSVLVRVPLGRGRGPALPQVPAGHTVTVTTGEGILAPALDDLLAAGYAIAGRAAGTPPDVVDLLVTPSVRRADTSWWRELSGRAAQVFDLRMGPVRLLLDGAVTAHLAARDGGAPR